MKRALALILLLAACREETAALPQPVDLTPETVGYYCQMNLLEHPGPKGQVHLDGLPGAPLFYSQVRDVVAYLRMPEQSHAVTAVYVNDMGAAASWEDPGPGNWAPLADVVFVVGSDRMGGMGVAELVPFRDSAKAAAFAGAHGGRVLALDDIPHADVVPTVADLGGEDEDFRARLRRLGQQTGG
ncbi:nitrous oxide reductase accessory protein NosL [Paracoccaceae bacterium Fryx2]|nr:nitrous oxide reductase accessory protein NosL [Paracoccaceae bacterium Fryx2]